MCNKENKCWKDMEINGFGDWVVFFLLSLIDTLEKALTIAAGILFAYAIMSFISSE